jgi:hypothetical protein
VEGGPGEGLEWFPCKGPIVRVLQKECPEGDLLEGVPWSGFPLGVDWSGPLDWVPSNESPGGGHSRVSLEGSLGGAFWSLWMVSPGGFPFPWGNPGRGSREWNSVQGSHVGWPLYDVPWKVAMEVGLEGVSYTRSPGGVP